MQFVINLFLKIILLNFKNIALTGYYMVFLIDPGYREGPTRPIFDYLIHLFDTFYFGYILTGPLFE